MGKTLKIAITGAGGFIGQHLLEDIVHSDHDIRILSRNISKRINHIPVGSEIVKADLNDYDSLKKAFSGVDIIINIAAEVRNSEKFIETNIAGTKNLIKAAIENKVSKIIHLSSVGVVGMQYNDSSIKIDEEAKCYPKNEYERTKLESEKIFIEARKNNNFLLTVLRPTNVFGERHPHNALLHLMNHIHSKKMTICSGLSTVNYVYVKDVTNIIIQLISDEKEYGIVNVGDAQNLNTFVKTIASELGTEPKIIVAPQFLFKFTNLLGIEKLKLISNGVSYDDKKLKTFYRYSYGFKAGLKKTIAYYKSENLI